MRVCLKSSSPVVRVRNVMRSPVVRVRNGPCESTFPSPPMHTWLRCRSLEKGFEFVQTKFSTYVIHTCNMNWLLKLRVALQSVTGCDIHMSPNSRKAFLIPACLLQHEIYWFGQATWQIKMCADLIMNRNWISFLIGLCGMCWIYG